ncbi:hypothetical protein [Planomonospora venezuelensis]|uniref:DUF3592 domain-containing protein n=1 Tax=Planomonospora venezuelensis TaxID=1999 RepID=A0A841D1M2_PLAVE|nr:hypothetical protein [Planomonospora venezuelensis]MBB5962404.1 hypothetical protein [Planomonospora venezuelensis]
MVEEALFRAGWWRTIGRGARLLAAVAVSWPVLGVAYAAGGWWWLPGLLALAVLLGVSIVQLVGISEDVPWAVWGMWPFFLVLALTAGLPGEYYMRAYGEPVSAVVAEREWVEGSRRKYDHYEYVLRTGDGRLVAEEFESHRDGLEIGARVEVLTDPLGVLEPLEPSEDLGLAETLARVAWGWITLMTVVLSVLGERRRRTMRPKGSGG